MKKFFRILSFVFVLGIYSCGDSCDGIECGPGVCEDGTCVCPDGLEGAACEINSNSVYFGDYEVVDATCGTSNNTTTIVSISIAAHSNGNPTEVKLTGSTSSTTATIDGTIVNGNIEAEGSFSTFTLGISGTFSDNDNFEATITGAGLVCRDVTYAK